MKVFIILALFIFFSPIIMAKEINTEIHINASPEKVWAILTNFDSYSQWNPFVKSLTGDVKVGNKIKIQLKEMSFKPKVLCYEKNKEFRWLGHLLMPGIFDGEHIFILVDNGDGTTTFRHSEKFKGLLVGMFSKKLDTETKQGFEEMNQKLKQLAEEK